MADDIHQPPPPPIPAGPAPAYVEIPPEQPHSHTPSPPADTSPLPLPLNPPFSSPSQSHDERSTSQSFQTLLDPSVAPADAPAKSTDSSDRHIPLPPTPDDSPPSFIHGPVESDLTVLPTTITAPAVPYPPEDTNPPETSYNKKEEKSASGTSQPAAFNADQQPIPSQYSQFPPLPQPLTAPSNTIISTLTTAAPIRYADHPPPLPPPTNAPPGFQSLQHYSGAPPPFPLQGLNNTNPAGNGTGGSGSSSSSIYQHRPVYTHVSTPPGPQHHQQLYTRPRFQRVVSRRTPQIPPAKVPIRTIEGLDVVLLKDLQRLLPGSTTLLLDGEPLITLSDEHGYELEPPRFRADPARVYEAFQPVDDSHELMRAFLHECQGLVQQLRSLTGEIRQWRQASGEPNPNQLRVLEDIFRAVDEPLRPSGSPSGRAGDYNSNNKTPSIDSGKAQAAGSSSYPVM
ncbi:hypothetical protein HK102_001102, partial [Quaeritorhiza haematococci]